VQGFSLATVKKKVLLGLELAIVRKVSKLLQMKVNDPIYSARYGIEDH